MQGDGWISSLPDLFLLSRNPRILFESLHSPGTIPCRLASSDSRFQENQLCFKLRQKCSWIPPRRERPKLITQSSRSRSDSPEESWTRSYPKPSDCVRRKGSPRRSVVPRREPRPERS